MILMLYYCCCKTFPTFTNKIWQHINRYHIGYIAGDIYPKIFFFTNFSKLLLNGTITTKWEMYDSN